MPTPSTAALAYVKLRAQKSAAPARAPTPAPARSSLIWFLPGGRISQYPHPAGGKSLAHVALDIAGVPAGAPIYEPVGGVVTSVQRLNVKPSFGLNVRVLTPAGIEEVFAHLSESDVKPGDRVSPGQFIGRVGNSGTQDVHLHYETRRPGADVFNRQWSTTSAVDPVSFLRSQSATAIPQLGAATASSRSTAAEAYSRLLALRSSSAPSSGITISAPAGSAGLGVAGAGALNAPGGKLTGPAFPPSPVDQPKPTTILKTPAGDVTIPAIHWWNVGGFALGSVLIVVALAEFGRGGVERSKTGITRLFSTQAQLAKGVASLAA